MCCWGRHLLTLFLADTRTLPTCATMRRHSGYRASIRSLLRASGLPPRTRINQLPRVSIVKVSIAVSSGNPHGGVQSIVDSETPVH
jgi:hypothetical protein